MLFLRNYRLNREPLLGLFFPSNAEVQKKRDIQNNTAKKICTLSPNFEKIAGKPFRRIGSSSGGGSESGGGRTAAVQTADLARGLEESKRDERR